MSAAWDRVQVIGIDDGGPDTLAASERALIESADLLCGGRRHLALFPDCQAERFAVSANLQALYGLLDQAPGRRRAVVLASGDPCFYGIGPLLAARLGREKVSIHPRPSSMALAFARLGLPLQEATVLSVHGRPIEEAVPAALAARMPAIFTDPEHTPAVIAGALLAAGMEDCPAYVCERLGGPDERIRELRLSSLPQLHVDPLNVLILRREPRAVGRPALGRPDEHYQSLRGQITKAEVRSIAITRLDPWRTGVAWDIGAGAGSIAIELASLMPRGAVYAVERDPEQVAVLRSNVLRHQAARVQVIPKAAPDALGSLPAPDAVFAGGSGDSLAEILGLAADRLRPGGRLVANFARLESLAIWQQVASQLGWDHDVVQISVARGTGAGAGTRLAALNPVFITRIQRPESVI